MSSFLSKSSFAHGDILSWLVIINMTRHYLKVINLRSDFRSMKRRGTLLSRTETHFLNSPLKTMGVE